MDVVILLENKLTPWQSNAKGCSSNQYINQYIILDTEAVFLLGVTLF